ncbi:malate transporter [Marinobacterium zhoushanense]|uniref:Malate transporter n=1 Tax=Marinobacterium zhoushanense TaxID=1679163 RepID=A0ABQ1JVJ1_9GAMM|nr:AEC family transporter [Marinobacterium zhoushanense]GGB78495.1 malate transporter [Marinobacterium zhoushanense]
MSSQIAIFTQIFTVTGPVFAMLVIGMVLKRSRLIDDHFISVASVLSYKALMPTLLFFGILRADLNTALQPKLIGYFYLATVLSFGWAWLWARRTVPAENRGLYVQGAFRGNCGIVGLALAASQYGDYGISVGGVMAGLIIVLFNVLSVIVLGVYSTSFKADVRSVIKDLARNPLILSVLAGLLASSAGVTLPEWIMVSADYFSSMTLPLALVCVGGTLSLSAFIDSGRIALSSSLFKVLWTPALFTLGAVLLGFEGRDLGMLYLFLASPTAAVSYVMARASGSDGKLAANIIAISTAISVITIMAGLYILRSFAFI